jgi:hypothetical protein
MAQPKHPPGPPMDLTNMRRQGVYHLIAYCLNDSCRHQALIDVSSYPADTLVTWFGGKVVCKQVRSAWPSYRCAAELEPATPNRLARALSLGKVMT